MSRDETRVLAMQLIHRN